MADLSQSFFRDFTPQQSSSPHLEPFLNCSKSTPTHLRQPNRVVCEVSYSGDGDYSARMREAQVSKAGDILQGALNAIVVGPRDDGISSRDWDVEYELKRFAESLAILARNARDSVTLARLRLEQRQEKLVEEGSGEHTEDGRDEGNGGGNGNLRQPDERKGKRSRRGRILNLWSGDYPGTIDGLLCAADKIMDEQVDELVRERMAKLVQLEDIVLNCKNCRAIFQEGINYISDLMIGKWNEFLAGSPKGGETIQPTPDDIQLAVIEMAKGIITKGYRTKGEVHRDKAQVYSVMRSHFARGYVRGQESLTTNAEVLNMEQWFLHGIEATGQNVDMNMPSFWTRDSGEREYWDEVSLGRLRPWGDKGSYKPSAPDASGVYPDDPIYLALTALEMQRNGIHEDDYTIRSFPLPKTIRLPFLGWSPIPPAVYQSWSNKTLLQDTTGNRRLLYERKDLDIARLRELVALKERWAEQDVEYLRRYRRYVVCDPEARERGYVDGGDISYLPAQRSPVVERVKGAAMEPMSCMIDTVTVDGEDEDGATERDSEEERAYELEAGSQILTTNPSAQPPADDSGYVLWPAASPSKDATNRDSVTIPLIAQIDEFLSKLAMAPPGTDCKNSRLKQSFSAPQLDLSSAGGSLGRRSEASEYHVSAIPRPLSAARKGGEKPLPLLPALDRGGLTVEEDEGEEPEGQGQQYPSNSDDLIIYPPSPPLSPLSTIKGAPYILRNSLPHRRSSPEAIQDYARAVEDLHGLRRINRYYSSSSINSTSNGNANEENSGVLATKTVRGRLLKAGGTPRSEISHDAEESVYSVDVGGERRGEGKSVVVGCFGVGSGGEGEAGRRRWGDLKKGGGRTGSQRKTRKEITDGIKNYFGVGR